MKYTKAPVRSPRQHEDANELHPVSRDLALMLPCEGAVGGTHAEAPLKPL